MTMVQYVVRPATKPASDELKAKKEVRQPFDERFTIEQLNFSRAPGLAKMIDSEFAIFEADRVWRFEEDWFRYMNNYHAKYGPDFVPIPGKSDVFVRRTRERVSTFRTEFLNLVLPLIGDPWSVEPSRFPRMVKKMSNGQAQVEAKAAAMNQKAKIKDYLQGMKFNRTIQKASLDYGLLGTMVLRGPRDRSAVTPRAVRIAADRWEMAEDVSRPWIEHIPLTRFYWDPQAPEFEDASACQVHWTFTARQLRDLGRQGVMDPNQVEALIKAFPNGLYQQTQWEKRLLLPVPTDARFTVIERWGVLPEDLQEEWFKDGGTVGADPVEAAERMGTLPDDDENPEHAEADSDDPPGFIPSTGIFETWSCGPFVLALNQNEFYEDCLPFTMIPLEKKYGTPAGQGAAEMIMDIQTVENALARGIIDNVAASSIPISQWDVTQLVPGADLSVYPGKVIQRRPNEFSRNQPVLKMDLQPNNSPQMVQAFGLFESMVPTATSLPTMQTPADMGSGMRSQGMQADYYSIAKSFTKLVVAEFDTYGWEKVIGWLIDWINAYEEDPSLHGDLDPVVEGVRGAIKREMVARQGTQLAELMSKDPELSGWLNKQILATEVLPYGFGLDHPDLVYTPQLKATKDAYDDMRAAQAQAMKEHATLTATNGLKAETSRADYLLQTATKMDDLNNPAWGPITAEGLAAHNALTSQAAIGLKAWSYRMAAQLASAGNPEAQAIGSLAYDPAGAPGAPGALGGAPAAPAPGPGGTPAPAAQGMSSAFTMGPQGPAVGAGPDPAAMAMMANTVAGGAR